MSKRHFFLGDLVLLFSIVAWGSPYGFSDFVRKLISRLSSHLMLVTVSKSVRGMYVSKSKKVFMVAANQDYSLLLTTSYTLCYHPPRPTPTDANTCIHGLWRCTEGRQPSVLQLLTLFSMKTRILVSKNATFP